MQDILKEKYDNTVFYEANLAWLEDNNNKKAYDTMWIEIVGACTSTIKKFVRKVPGIYNKDDILDFAVESAERVVKSIVKNKTKVKNLSNYVFMYCYGVFYSVKRQKQDKLECSFTYETSDMVDESFEDRIIARLDNELFPN